MDTKEHVEHLLKTYHECRQSLELVEYQITSFSGVSYDEGIAGLNFTTPEGERVQNNNVSDKSGRIALMYRDIVDKQNGETLSGMLKQYHDQKNELDTLDYCITHLEQRLSDVIMDMFINRMSWDYMCNKYYVSQNMLSKYRKKGVGEIAKVFEFRRMV